MKSDAMAERYGTAPVPIVRELPKLAFVAAAYYLGAEIAFFIGTLSDKIFAPFWPPNIVLFCALVFAPPGRWWLYILAALPMHVLAEIGVGMNAVQLLVAFVTNAMVATADAAGVRLLVGAPPSLGEVRAMLRYGFITAIASPAVVALVGAFVPIAGGGSTELYATYWTQWYASNALGSLTLGTVALIWLGNGLQSYLSAPLLRKLEAVLLFIVLVAVCTAAFEVSIGAAKGFLPALLYSPLPLILWAAVRFGVSGASAAVLTVSAVLVWRTLNGPTLFIASDPETSVLAMQVFLIGLSIPVLLLGAAIEEARRAEQATRQSEEQMAFAAASVNIGLWQYSLATGRFWTTEHCRTMLGLREDVALTYEAIKDVVHDEDREAVLDSIQAAIRTGSPAECEFRTVAPDSQTRWMVLRAHTEHDEQNRPIHISGLFADITGRKTAEHEIELQRRELAHLMRVAVMGELSGAIAHELNQPLTAILANAQAARHLVTHTAPNIAEISDALDDIVSEDNRAGEVIRRMWTLLKKGDRKLELIGINTIIEGTLRLMHSELVSRKVKTDLSLQDNLPMIYGDTVQMQQVLLNLVMNAIEAMNATASTQRVLSLHTRAIGAERIEVVVADRGRGISFENEQRLFEAFFSTKDHGLGLGLSICSSIVNSHGGTLRITNNASGGARATVILPARQPATEDQCPSRNT